MTDGTSERSIWLSGESGEGIVSLGELVSKGAVKLGLQVFTYRTFPAEVKGGTVLFKLRARMGPAVLSSGEQPDIFVALNQEGYDLYAQELRSGGLLVYDTDGVQIQERPGLRTVGIPFTSIAKKDLNFPLAKNMVCYGSVWTALGGPPEFGEESVRTQFKRKGEEVVDLNVRAFHLGREHVLAGLDVEVEALPVGEPLDAMLLNGNQAVSVGAIAAGLKLFAGYPITPSSEIMETVAKDIPYFGGKMIQAEDEIAALGMCLGASYSGQKVMTATSGPGLSLMVEQLNLAGVAELPVVVVDVQRGGASTGMPTKTSQGDLNIAALGMHNESPRVVIAPISVEDCFYSTIHAFNIAERYQMPVLILSEQALSASECTVPVLDPKRIPLWERVVDYEHPPRFNGNEEEGQFDWFQRYQDTPNGISPMPRPGTPWKQYTSTGLEHNERGDPIYDPPGAKKMASKRFRKLDDFVQKHMDEFIAYFGEDGEVEIGIIAWGSNINAIREGMEQASEHGIRCALIAPRILWPVPVPQLQAFAKRARKLICIENNLSGQFANLVRAHAGLTVTSCTRDTGLPFEPSTILGYILSAREGSMANV